MKYLKNIWNYLAEIQKYVDEVQNRSLENSKTYF